MEIRALREKMGLSQSEFSKYFGIPVGSVRNWEQGLSNPPAYVVDLIYRVRSLELQIFGSDYDARQSSRLES